MSVKLIENRSEIGAGTRGAGYGVDALKVASLKAGSTFFSKNEMVTIKDENHLLYKDISFERAKRIEGIVKVYHTIANTVKNTLDEGDFPLVLAADHSSAGGTIAGVKMKYPNKRLGVIWIDAHADLHSPYTSPSGNVHGMPLATAINQDNMDCKVNEVKDGAHKNWEKLKNCGDIAPKVSPDDIVFYGVRDTEHPENHLIEKFKIKNFTVDECRTKSIETVVKEGLEILKNCDIIYISFDVDSLDCNEVSLGTGTPVPNGFSPKEVNDLIQGLIQSEKLVCFEMVEINPMLDNKQNLMAETAFTILENTFNTIEKTKLS